MKENTLFSTTGITDSNRILHTPGDFAKRNLLYVQEVGKLKSLQPHKSQRENLDSFLFLGVISGKGKITTGNITQTIKSGDCVLLNCMEYYAHESSEDSPWELMWVHFNGHNAKNFFELFIEKNNGKCVFRPDKIKKMEQLIEQLMVYQLEKDLEADLLSGSILLQIVNICLVSAMGYEKKEQDKDRKLCKNIREYININYYEKNLIQNLTDEFLISKDEIDRAFFKSYGIGVEDYILNRRLTASKEMLRFTIEPEAVIAKKVGIESEIILRELFQESEGMMPEDYRMKWSQWVK